MNTDNLRGLFAAFLKEQEMDGAVAIDGCVTIGQDEKLRYERIDKYRVLFLDRKQMKKLLAFCIKHGIDVWLGADKLCIGFNYKGNMRLSADDSVLPGEISGKDITDRLYDEPRAIDSSVALPP